MSTVPHEATLALIRDEPATYVLALCDNRGKATMDTADALQLAVCYAEFRVRKYRVQQLPRRSSARKRVVADFWEWAARLRTMQQLTSLMLVDPQELEKME